MWLAFMLLVACMFQVYAHASTESDLEDILFQQAALTDDKGDAYLQSNGTNLEENNEQHDLIVALLESTALAQLDQLSLVTRYAGTGYNLVRGNPEGDFNLGGVDPGIRTTQEIFAHTYTSRKKAFYRGRVMQVPDQVNFHMSQSCGSSHTVQAYSGRKSYMKELQNSVGVSGGYSGLFAFSLSNGMSRAEAMTEKQKHIVIQKNKICNFGRARYIYENAVAGEQGYTLSRSFKNSVQHQLPTTYNERAYMRFIEQWGTHIIIAVDVGTREIMRSTASYQEVYKYLRKKNSLSTSFGGWYGPVSASAGFSINTLNENINQNTRLGQSMRKFTIGSRDVPLPIHLDLKPITKALDKNWWGGTVWWKRNKIDINRKQRNLVKALRDYPRYVHAKKNEDPKIKFRTPVASLRILGAAYGRADVTTRLNSRITHSQTLHVSASNHAFGDSWWGVKKTLVVVYQHEGYLPRIRIVREHHTLTIGQKLLGRNVGSQPGNGLRIAGAAYGLGDVTHKVQSKVRNNRLHIAASNRVFGDTWPWVRKTLVVVYQYGNGSYRTKIVTEGHTLRIP